MHLSPAAERVSGSTLTLALDAMPLTADPRWPADYNARLVSAAVGRTLLGEPGNLDEPPYEGVASSVCALDDGTRWCVTIADDAFWSDGVAVQAGDVVASIRDVIARPNTAAGAYFADRGTRSGINTSTRSTKGTEGALPSRTARVEAVDSSHVVIELNRPMPYLPHLLTMPQFMPVRMSGDQGSSCMGPFRLHSMDERVIELRRVRSAGLQEPEHLRFVWTSTWDEALWRYSSGEVDLTPTTSCGPVELDRIRARSDAVAHPIGVFGSLELGGRLADLTADLRRALASVLDTRELSEKLAGLVLPSAQTGADFNPSARDVDGLKRALRDGVEIAHSDFAPNDAVVGMVAARIREAFGVRVSVSKLSFSQYVRAVIRRDRDLLYTLTGTDFAHSAALWTPWHSVAPAARNAGLDDPVLDRLIEDAEAVTGQDENSGWDKVAHRWMELMPRIPLLQVQANYLRSRRAESLRMTFSGLPIDFRTL